MKTPTRAATATALLGIGFATYEVTHQMPGIGFALVALAGLALVRAVAAPRPAALALFGTALALTLLLAVRASLVWQFLDLCAALALAVLAASYSQGGNPAVGTVRGWTVRGVRLFTAIPAGFAFLTPPKPKSAAIGRSLTMARTLLVIGVLLLLFGSLLASADAVFADVVSTPFHWNLDLGSLPQTIVGTLLAAIAAAVVLAYSVGNHRFAGEGELSLPLPLTRGEWIAALGSVAVLFAGFVVIQFSYLFGGAEQISVPGMTYAEYARSGFVQMILAAILTLALIGSAWLGWARRESSPAPFRVLSSLLVCLNLVVLASASKRLTLYESAYGWTQARLIAHALIGWLAVFLILTLAALAARKTAWLSPAAAVLSVVTLLAVNALNPDAFIADKNLARYRETGKIDAAYLATLSPDATPTLIASLDDLSPKDRDLLTAEFSCEAGNDDGPWYSWNLGRARASAALEQQGIPPTAGDRACSVPSF